MKKTALIIAMGYACSVCQLQAAGNGAVNFTGNVVNQTCNVSVNGGSNSATVALPVVQASVLAAEGDTAGTTTFIMDITGCNTPSANGSGSVKVFFENGPNVDTNGRLKNTTTTSGGGAGNVVLQLLDNATNNFITVGGKSQLDQSGTAYANGFTTIDWKTGKASRAYSVRYYATGVSTAGTVTSSVTYTLVYF